ncbi:MAG: prenyltransferase [Anaerolineaceae bacterium]
MNERNPDALQYFITAARPDILLGAILFYAMGAGIVHFLGNSIDWVTYWVGQGMVTLIQLSSAFLFAYFNFDALKAEVNFHKSPQSNIPDKEETLPRRKTPENEPVLRLSFLQAGLVALTIGAVFTVMLGFSGNIEISAYFLIGISLAAGLAYALPPTNFGRTGYGELISTLFLTILTPGLAYVLQAGEMHRLLTLLSFPLSALVLASLMAVSLERYHNPETSTQKNLMTQMGWQKGMQFHNILIFVAYLLFAVAALAGLPWALTWPAVLSLPVGLFQVWQMRQIAIGVKPHWKLLKWTAFGVVAMTVYLISLAVWTS